MKKVAVYVRVSTSSQGTESQVPDLKRYAAAQAGDCVWFTDKASGLTMDRPAWLKLWKLVEAGEVERVVVWRLDRLGRTAKGLTALFDGLLRRKVGLVSIRDGIDLQTPAGRLMANVLASVAQYETEVRAERVHAGQAVAKAAGKTWGGSQPGRQLHVTDEQVATIRRMKREGEKVAAIARATGLSRPTVYHWINAA